MPRLFELTLGDGDASLTDAETRTAVKLAGRERWAYDNAQHATELAMHAVAATTGRMIGDVVDEPALVAAFTAGALALVVAGHPRECRVVAVHLHARYGFDFDRMTAPPPSSYAVRLEPVTDVPDRYATFRFESNLKPLELMRGLVERWVRESEREPQANERALHHVQRWRTVLSLGEGDGAPLTVVVTGVTGAGKSTFLNAVLGREVLPHSTSICTAALLRMRKAATPADEGFVVTWRPIEEMRAQVEDLEAEKRFLEGKRAKVANALASYEAGYIENPQKLAARADFVSWKIGAMKSAIDIAKEAPRRLPLSELPPYARNAPDSWAEAVSFIQIFLDIPLLEHVELVDAPGLRDGDDTRQKLLIKAFEGDVAWLYVAPASTRDNSCVADWEHIRKLAHNDAGVLVLTKADSQNPDGFQSIAQAVASRMLDYRAYGWQRPIEWCSALLPALLGALTPAADETAIDRLWRAANPALVLDLPGRADGRLKAFLVDRPRVEGDWFTFRDYALDASRVPSALRRVGKTLYHDAVARRVSDIHGEIVRAIEEALERVAQDVAHAEETLRAHDIVAHERERLAQANANLAELKEKLSSVRETNWSSLHDAQREAEKARSALTDAVGRHTTNLKWVFEKSFQAQTKGSLSGDRSFSLVTAYEAPLNEMAHQLIGQLVERITSTAKPDDRSRALNATDLLKNYVLVDSRGDVHDREGFWESDTAAMMRMWGKTQLSAADRGARIVEGFRARLDEVLGRLKTLLDDTEGEHAAAIRAREAEVAELRDAVERNEPAQSLEKARSTIVRCAEHREAFGSLLTEVRSAQVTR